MINGEIMVILRETLEIPSFQISLMTNRYDEMMS